ncbi:MAG: hypothetical protein LBB04_01765 [Oscillospiraceae bacterium]|nr:hypothetical protein [Oscillospiraceae bacterium]
MVITKKTNKVALFLVWCLMFSVMVPFVNSAFADDLDVEKLKMYVLGIGKGSNTPSQSNTEDRTFSQEKDRVDISGRFGSHFYIIFGESTDSKKYIGNRDNTYQGTENNRNDYSVKVVLDRKTKVVDGMSATATYVQGLSNVKNGVWGVRLDFPEKEVSLSVEVTYEYTITVTKKSTGQEISFVLVAHLVPPEVVDKSFVELASTNQNIMELKYTNPVKVFPSGFEAMRKTKKRDFTFNFANGIVVYIPKVTRQKDLCLLGGNPEACPDMEDRVIKPKVESSGKLKRENSVFFVTVSGVMLDPYRLTCPISVAFESDTEQAAMWKNGEKVYVYPVNVPELEAKTSLSDKVNLIDFTRVMEAEVRDGGVQFTIKDDCIDPKNEFFMVSLKQISENDFPTDESKKLGKSSGSDAVKKTTTSKKKVLKKKTTKKKLAKKATVATATGKTA